MRHEKREIDDLDDEFMWGFILRCQFTILVKDSRYSWRLFGANIG